MYHKVRIEYYPPRGDAKEGWDNIDIFGWLGYPMQIKINFLCRDSILAAPLVLDLVLFMDLAQRAGMRGVQEWLSFYFKAPMHAPEVYPEHDVFIQLMKLEEYPAIDGRGRPDYAPGVGVLRLVRYTSLSLETFRTGRAGDQGHFVAPLKKRNQTANCALHLAFHGCLVACRFDLLFSPDQSDGLSRPQPVKEKHDELDRNRNGKDHGA